MLATLPRLVVLKEGDLLQGRMRNMAAKKTALVAVRLQIPSFPRVCRTVMDRISCSILPHS